MSLKIYSKFQRLLLEVEVTVNNRRDFEIRYAEATGTIPQLGSHFQIQDNKWGCECRIYFDAENWVVDSFEKMGHTVESRVGVGYRSEYAYRINSQELFWRLIEYGYRIGDNTPIPYA